MGFVPTMGAFHAGHESLMNAARRECDHVVVSIFVNPTQFTDNTEFGRYPRDEEQDARIAERQGADVLFAPEVPEIYPSRFATTVSVAGELVEMLRRTGLTKDGQLTGMCTIITKLLNIVQPDVVYFGEKDLPHWVAVERMARDLNLPQQIKVLPTVREPDGLAMSSRNVHLGENRKKAVVLHQVLSAVASNLKAGETDAAALRARALSTMDFNVPDGGVTLEYFEILDRDTLEPVTAVRAPVILAIGARVGDVSLLDILRPELPESIRPADPMAALAAGPRQSRESALTPQPSN
ncbi:pantothenate synthetase [Lentzea flava]|uniref:Pantothenate synthetase n=1 Tax=Lentzea flava TaxID=103732 RepID=A0ABQ2UL79_9PSEU|nr:pantoate--beta-alanine ligase [Lentzea flava]GGU43326.1 pantothenate synthetase [Lentzea flava]